MKINQYEKKLFTKNYSNFTYFIFKGLQQSARSENAVGT